MARLSNHALDFRRIPAHRECFYLSNSKCQAQPNLFFLQTTLTFLFANWREYAAHRFRLHGTGNKTRHQSMHVGASFPGFPPTFVSAAHVLHAQCDGNRLVGRSARAVLSTPRDHLRELWLPPAGRRRALADLWRQRRLLVDSDCLLLLSPGCCCSVLICSELVNCTVRMAALHLPSATELVSGSPAGYAVPAATPHDSSSPSGKMRFQSSRSMHLVFAQCMLHFNFNISQY